MLNSCSPVEVVVHISIDGQEIYVSVDGIHILVKAKVATHLRQQIPQGVYVKRCSICLSDKLHLKDGMEQDVSKITLIDYNQFDICQKIRFYICL